MAMTTDFLTLLDDYFMKAGLGSVVGTARGNQLMSGAVLTAAEWAALDTATRNLILQRYPSQTRVAGAAGGTPTATVMKTYTHFTTDDVVDNMTRRVTTGMWSGDTGSLANFYIGTSQSGSTGDWYYDVYNLDPNTDDSAEVQFSVAYGEINGGGYPNVTTKNTSKEPTKAIYAQYRNILLDPEDTKFTFAGSYSSDQILAININRARLKQKMDPGNWELWLKYGANTVKLIDDSGDNFDKLSGVSGRRYNVVTGSIANGVLTPAASETPGGFGLFYPDRGIIILSPLTLAGHLAGLSFVTSDSGSAQNNHRQLVGMLQSGSYFAARNEEVVSSTTYFVRVKNREYNFSNNPTFYTSSDGSIKISTFIGDPKVYITTVGLYDDSNQLLAVAKISQPILKAFDREALIKVRLDW